MAKFTLKGIEFLRTFRRSSAPSTRRTINSTSGAVRDDCLPLLCEEQSGYLEHHVRRCRDHIALQELIVGLLRDDGRDARRAEGLLTDLRELEQVLVIFGKRRTSQ